MSCVCVSDVSVCVCVCVLVCMCVCVCVGGGGGLCLLSNIVISFGLSIQFHSIQCNANDFIHWVKKSHSH